MAYCTHKPPCERQKGMISVVSRPTSINPISALLDQPPFNSPATMAIFTTASRAARISAATYPTRAGSNHTHAGADRTNLTPAEPACGRKRSNRGSHRMDELHCGKPPIRCRASVLHSLPSTANSSKSSPRVSTGCRWRRQFSQRSGTWSKSIRMYIERSCQMNRSGPHRERASVHRRIRLSDAVRLIRQQG